MNARSYAMAVQSARRTFDRTGDTVGYVADCIHIAAKMGADALAAENPRLRHLGTTLTVASPAFKSAIEEVIHLFSCPIEAGHSPQDFLRAVALNARHHIDRDYAIVGKIMTHLGI